MWSGVGSGAVGPEKVVIYAKTHIFLKHPKYNLLFLDVLFVLLDYQTVTN